MTFNKVLRQPALRMAGEFGCSRPEVVECELCRRVKLVRASSPVANSWFVGEIGEVK